MPDNNNGGQGNNTSGSRSYPGSEYHHSDFTGGGDTTGRHHEPRYGDYDAENGYGSWAENKPGSGAHNADNDVYEGDVYYPGEEHNDYGIYGAENQYDEEFVDKARDMAKYVGLGCGVTIGCGFAALLLILALMLLLTFGIG